MNIQLLFFGITTDLVGASSLEFTVPENCTVVDLKDQLQHHYLELENINSYAIAVNESYATDDTILRANDVVAIIPPVSGG